MHYFKYLGSKESARQLWENRESLDKYLKRLRELMCEKINEIVPVYCDYIPDVLEPGKLYIAGEFNVAVHSCACGCGGKTVTPLGAGEWALTENDARVTLRPSIGNFSGESPYHAHYYITDNKIEWL
jgi:hypothetical protein